jgi:hypothetical protein
MRASELFRPQHRVNQVGKGRDAQHQREQRHGVAYTPSQNATNATIVANVASARITIHTWSIVSLRRVWPFMSSA